MSEPTGQITLATVWNGKYTVIQDTNGGLFALRYGEPWRYCTGDNLVLALAYRVQELEECADAKCWKPISTHMRNSHHVLLTDGRRVLTGYYGGAESGWRTSDTAAMWPEPTHWMPLPPLPKVQSQPQREGGAE